MLCSRFFWRLYLTYAGLVLLTSVGIGLLVHTRLRPSSEEELETSLRNQCVLLAPLALAAAEGSREVGEEIGSLSDQVGARITLIHPDGRVLADSHDDPARMENHRNRPEVLLTESQPFGVGRRFSSTLGYPMLYVAHRVPSSGEAAVIVRLALEMEAVDESLAVVTRAIVFGGAVSIVVALGLGLLVGRRITAPIGEMTEVAEALRAGSYDRRVTSLPHDEIGILGATLNRLAEEITGRIQTIQSDEARLRAILAAMVEGVVAVDDEDRVIFCNTMARRMLGLGDGQLRGRPLWELVRVAGLASAMQEARTGSVGTRRELILATEEREGVVEALINPFQTETGSGLMVVLHDVSHLRRLEQIRRDFVANVSHELKTPLTSIQGFVETLLDGAIDDKENNTRFLTRIQSNVKRLSFLVSDLLSLARIESQRDQLDVVPLELFEIVNEVVAAHEPEITKRGLEVAVDGSGIAGHQVLGEPEAVREVVENLVGNAVKYTPQGGRITISGRRDPAYATLCVADTGIGIPTADLERVFERFYRVDKAHSRELGGAELGGTGLGLSIVKHLTLAMGGEVSVESEVGRGSRFRVKLPLAT